MVTTSYIAFFFSFYKIVLQSLSQSSKFNKPAKPLRRPESRQQVSEKSHSASRFHCNSSSEIQHYSDANTSDANTRPQERSTEMAAKGHGGPQLTLLNTPKQENL